MNERAGKLARDRKIELERYIDMTQRPGWDFVDTITSMEETKKRKKKVEEKHIRPNPMEIARTRRCDLLNSCLLQPSRIEVLTGLNANFPTTCDNSTRINKQCDSSCKNVFFALTDTQSRKRGRKYDVVFVPRPTKAFLRLRTI